VSAGPAATPGRRQVQGLPNRGMTAARSSRLACFRQVSNPPQAFQCPQTGRGNLGALYDEMPGEEPQVFRVLVKLLRCQYGRENRHLGLKLDLHQCADHGVGHELVAVDAAVDDEAAGDDGHIAAGSSQLLGVKRDLEGARDFKQVDRVTRDAAAGHFRQEGIAALIDHVRMPA